MLDLYEHLSSDNETCSSVLAKQNIARIEQIEGSAVLVGEVDGEIRTACTVIVVPNLTRGGRPYAMVDNVVTALGSVETGWEQQSLMLHPTEHGVMIATKYC